MRLVLFALVLGAITLIIPNNSYADSNFALVGNGFGTIDDDIKALYLHLLLQIPESGKSVFQSGQISIGDDSFPMEKASLSLSSNKKSLRLSAETGDVMMTASGKLVLSVGEDSIYHLNGKTSNGGAFSVFAILQQDKLTDVQTEDSAPKKDILLLVKHTDRVEWKSQYKFIVRTFDPRSNPLFDFYDTSGYLEGISVSATLTNPLGEIIKTSSGTTQKFGYYEDSIIIPDNMRTGTYKLSVTVSGNDYKETTKELSLVVTPD